MLALRGLFADMMDVTLVRSGAVAAAIYVYTTGSPFEARMNAYMTNGFPVVPITPGSLLNISSSNVSSVQTMLNPDRPNSSVAAIKPLSSGQFMSLDTT